jgi:hypothetical protein
MADNVMKTLYNSMLNYLETDIKRQTKIANPDEFDGGILKKFK